MTTGFRRVMGKKPSQVKIHLSPFTRMSIKATPDQPKTMDNRIVFRDGDGTDLLTIFPREFRRVFIPKVTGNQVQMVYNTSELIVNLNSTTGTRILANALTFLLDDSVDIVCTFLPANFTKTFDFDDMNQFKNMVYSLYPDITTSHQFCGQDLLPNMPTVGGTLPMAVSREVPPLPTTFGMVFGPSM